MDNTQHPYKYKAFISYSHSDRRWARWLMKRLESYRTPRRLVGLPTPSGPVPATLSPVFRDRDELASGGELSDSLQEALRNSAALIVIASPDSAKSAWVNQEIIEYKKLHGESRVFVLMVAGDPDAADDQQCLAPALRHHVNAQGELQEEEIELLAADARKIGDGPRRALLRLISGLLHVDYNQLRRRELQRRHRRMAAITTVSVLVMAISLVLAATAYLARQDAERRRLQAEDLLEFMVGDLRESLEPIGQLHVLEDVADKALAYFASAQSSDLSPTGLARRARVLTHVGSIRLQQLDYPGATQAFKEAYNRARDLALANPQDQQVLFERGQSEYWVGFAYWEQGDLETTQHWWDRYLHTSQALLALDPVNPKWRREVGYGHHNLGALAVNLKQLQRARTSFESELAELEPLYVAHPDDLGLGADIADVLAWLGQIEVEAGQLKPALDRYQQSRRGWEALLASNPGHTAFKFHLSSALLYEFEIALKLGRADPYDERLEEAMALRADLATTDPDNKRRLIDHLKSQLLAIELRFNGMNRHLAQQALEKLLEQQQSLPALDENDWVSLQALMDTYRLLARVAVDAGDLPAAERFMRDGLEIMTSLQKNDDPHVTLVISVTKTMLFAELIQRTHGIGTGVTPADVNTYLEAYATKTQHLGLLEQVARTQLQLGQEQAAAQTIAHLTAADYVPLDPWPGLSTESEGF